MMSKKGITPIIALIMLMIIVIGLAGGFMLWIRKSFGVMQNQTQQQIESQMGRAAKTISIDECNPGGDEIYVRNTGSMKINSGDIGVYVNNAKLSVSDWPGFPVSPGGTGTIGLSTGVLSSGDKVKVSAPGNSDTTTC